MIFDYIIIGGGISGVAIGYELAKHGTVLILEMEDASGYHATGRSAALYTRNFGNQTASKICQVSLDFLQNPPKGFTQTPLLKKRGHLFVQVKPDENIDEPYDENALINAIENAMPESPVHEISIDKALELCPLLKRDQITTAAFEEGVYDIDVDALLSAYMRGMSKSGGTIKFNAKVEALKFANNIWRVDYTGGSVEGRIIINAAGPWSALIAQKAKASDLGLTVKRRSAILISAPKNADIATMPAIDFKGTPAYMKPDAGRIMASSGNQTPTEPQDAQAEEFDIAMAAHYVSTYTDIKIDKIDHAWAGIRSYTSDGAPAIGFDPQQPKFFWLAGQAGYGIMMAPSLARAATHMIMGQALPDDFAALGITALNIDPTRLVR